MKHRPTDTPAASFGENLKAWRKEQGWSQQRLAEQFSDLGVPSTREVIANLETGRRGDVTVSELFAAALALNVAPVDLLVPDGARAPIRVVPEVGPDDAGAVHRWIAGRAPLDSYMRDSWEDFPRSTSAEDIKAEATRRQRDFYRHVPAYVRVRHEWERLPIEAALRLLTIHAQRASMRRDYRMKRPERRKLAAALRDALQKVSAHVEVLCSELETTDEFGGLRDGFDQETP